MSTDTKVVKPQTRAEKRREEKKIASDSRPKSLAEKQSIMDGLVLKIEFTRGKIFPWHLDDIDAIERGLKTDLAKLVERCRHEEIDLKIRSMQRVIGIIEGSNKE